MEIYPGVTFSEELEGQLFASIMLDMEKLFASIMLDMEKLISAYRRMLRQGNHAATRESCADGYCWVMVSGHQKKPPNMSAAF